MSPEIPRPEDVFGFTEQEALDERITDKRFRELLTDGRTAVHQIEVSTNNYGEFLFVTVSRKVREDRAFVTFWGAGYHEGWGRWLINEWCWFRADQFPNRTHQEISKDVVKAQLQGQLRAIKA